MVSEQFYKLGISSSQAICDSMNYFTTTLHKIPTQSQEHCIRRRYGSIWGAVLWARHNWKAQLNDHVLCWVVICSYCLVVQDVIFGSDHIPVIEVSDLAKLNIYLYTELSLHSSRLTWQALAFRFKHSLALPIYSYYCTQNKLWADTNPYKKNQHAVHVEYEASHFSCFANQTRISSWVSEFCFLHQTIPLILSTGGKSFDSVLFSLFS